MRDATTPPTADHKTPWLAIAAAIGSLLAIFAWVYARFAGTLYFAMDDYIQAEVILGLPLGEALWGFFRGGLTWSGYRPASTGFQAILLHLFGMQSVAPYYIIGMVLHLANALLVFHLVWRVVRHVLPAFLASMFFLLLPSHNEAILVMSFNLNVLAMFFALLATECALAFPLAELSGATFGGGSSLFFVAGTAIATLMAILSYEVTLALVVLIPVADWLILSTRAPELRTGLLRRRVWLYGALIVAAVVSLGLRWWATNGEVTPDRVDYGVSLAPTHLLYGYAQLFGQIALLFNSPWIHLPDFVYTREWMSPTNPRALVSIVLAAGTTLVTIWLSLRNRTITVRLRDALLWAGWGALWLVSVSLPFVVIAGRDPENRYTYIPSFGAAVIFAALFAWAFAWVGKQTWRTLGTGALALLAAAWLGVYAWVTTSDVAEYGRAAEHARALLSTASTLPLGDYPTVAEVGMPFDVGSAYVFSTDDAFAAAMRLHGATQDATILAGDLAVGALPSDLPEVARETLLIGYDRLSHRAEPIAIGLFCPSAGNADGCQQVAFAEDVPAESAWAYVQVYNDADAASGGIGMLATMDGEMPVLQACWQFLDLKRFQADPASFDNAAVAARCQSAFDGLLPRISQLFADSL